MATTLLTLTSVYAMIGIAVAAYFVLRLGDLDEGAEGQVLFRVLVAPGAVLIWPIVLLRMREIHRDAHGPERPPLALQQRLSQALIVAIPVILAVALAVRQDGPYERAPVEVPPAEAEGQDR